MRAEYANLRRDLETIRQANLAEAAANPRMASLVVTHLNHPALERDVSSFECQHAIELPEEYREFLLTVANGGVGPFYGLEPLGQFSRKDWAEWPGLVGDLSIPFPYSDEWNITPIDKSLPDEERWKRQDWYWSAHHVHGAIPICDLGCGLRQLLIVTGTERGNIWFDDRVDWKGLYPDLRKDGSRRTFFDWYRNWADAKLQTAP